MKSNKKPNHPKHSTISANTVVESPVRTLYYDQPLENMEPNINMIFELVKELFWEREGEISLWFHPREGLNEVKKIRRVAQKLITIADEVQPVYAAMEEVRQAKRKSAFDRIEKKADVVGVEVHEANLGGVSVCLRCVNRLKNPNGTPFKLSQAGAEDLIWEDDDAPCYKRLKEKGCLLCNLKTSLVPPDSVKDEPPYCMICHRPSVYL